MICETARNLCLKLFKIFSTCLFTIKNAWIPRFGTTSKVYMGMLFNFVPCWLALLDIS